MASSQQVVDALNDLIFTDARLMDSLIQFADSYCHEFDYVADSADDERVENKLVYTTLHKMFTEVVESAMTTVLQAQGWSLEQFLQFCADEEARAEKSPHVVPVHSWFVSMTDYNEFKKLMLERRRLRSRE
jgi:hypothetical protein